MARRSGRTAASSEISSAPLPFIRAAQKLISANDYEWQINIYNDLTESSWS